MEYSFWSEKNETLIRERGFSFEDIIESIQRGNLLETRSHPNADRYPHQHILYVQMSDGVYAIPCIQNEDETFLKTAYRSRTATKRFNS